MKSVKEIKPNFPEKKLKKNVELDRYEKNTELRFVTKLLSPFRFGTQIQRSRRKVFSVVRTILEPIVLNFRERIRNSPALQKPQRRDLGNPNADGERYRYSECEKERREISNRWQNAKSAVEAGIAALSGGRLVKLSHNPPCLRGGGEGAFQGSDFEVRIPSNQKQCRGTTMKELQSSVRAFGVF